MEGEDISHWASQWDGVSKYATEVLPLDLVGRHYHLPSPHTACHRGRASPRDVPEITVHPDGATLTRQGRNGSPTEFNA
jgi:hypothetical protein